MQANLGKKQFDAGCRGIFAQAGAPATVVRLPYWPVKPPVVRQPGERVIKLPDIKRKPVLH